MTRFLSISIMESFVFSPSAGEKLYNRMDGFKFTHSRKRKETDGVYIWNHIKMTIHNSLRKTDEKGHLTLVSCVNWKMESSWALGNQRNQFATQQDIQTDKWKHYGMVNGTIPFSPYIFFGMKNVTVTIIYCNY